jgi:hypothetical protein
MFGERVDNGVIENWCTLVCLLVHQQQVKLHTQTISLLLPKNVVFLYFDLQNIFSSTNPIYGQIDDRNVQQQIFLTVGRVITHYQTQRNNISEGKVFKSQQVLKFCHLVIGYH